MVQQHTDSENGKSKIAFLSIALSVIGCLLSFVFRTPLMDAFTPGTLCTLIALPLSLLSVRDRGSNALALTAFILSTAGAFITVGLSAK